MPRLISNEDRGVGSDLVYDVLNRDAYARDLDDAAYYFVTAIITHLSAVALRINTLRPRRGG